MAIRPFLRQRRPGGLGERHVRGEEPLRRQRWWRTLGVPTAADVEEATAVGGRERVRRGPACCPSGQRADALDHARLARASSETIEDEFARARSRREGGKPLKWATVEATRAVSTFRWASEVIRHGPTTR